MEIANALPELRRKIGLPDATVPIAATLIGSGTFTDIAEMPLNEGTPALRRCSGRFPESSDLLLNRFMANWKKCCSGQLSHKFLRKSFDPAVDF